MRFKIVFDEFVESRDTCEVVIEADTENEALRKFDNRDFTMYLRTGTEANRHSERDNIKSISQVN